MGDTAAQLNGRDPPFSRDTALEFLQCFKGLGIVGLGFQSGLQFLQRFVIPLSIRIKHSQHNMGATRRRVERLSFMEGALRFCVSLFTPAH